MLCGSVALDLEGYEIRPGWEHWAVSGFLSFGRTNAWIWITRLVWLGIRGASTGQMRPASKQLRWVFLRMMMGGSLAVLARHAALLGSSTSHKGCSYDTRLPNSHRP